MKWYIETNKFNFCVDADSLDEALNLYNHVVFGRRWGTDDEHNPLVIDRISKKPTRKIVYLEVA